MDKGSIALYMLNQEDGMSVDIKNLPSSIVRDMEDNSFITGNYKEFSYQKLLRALGNFLTTNPFVRFETGRKFRYCEVWTNGIKDAIGDDHKKNKANSLKFNQSDWLTFKGQLLAKNPHTDQWYWYSKDIHDKGKEVLGIIPLKFKEREETPTPSVT
jgi:hypothetical protein